MILILYERIETFRCTASSSVQLTHIDTFVCKNEFKISGNGSRLFSFSFPGLTGCPFPTLSNVEDVIFSGESFTDHMGGTRYAGGTAQLTCETGHILESVGTLACATDGTWTPNTVGCTGKSWALNYMLWRHIQINQTPRRRVCDEINQA